MNRFYYAKLLRISIFYTGYIAVCIYYLIGLNNLNNELAFSEIKNPFLIISYNGYTPFIYVFGGFSLCFLGIYIVIMFYKTIKTLSLSCFFKYLILVIVILIYAIVIYILWCEINQPILRAFIIVIIAIGVFISDKFSK